MSQDQRRYIPPWLRRMRGWEETPDWLLEKIQKEQGGFSFLELGITPEAAGFGSDVEPVQEESDEPEPEGGEDLRDAYERERQGSSRPSSTEQATGIVPEAAPAEPEQGEEESPPTRKRSGVTDWLVDLEEEASSEVEAPPPTEMRESSTWTAELGGIPAEASATGGGDLSAPGEGEGEGGAPPRQSGVTDWLAHLEEEPLEAEPPTSGPTGTAPGAAPERTDIPDWLASLEPASGAAEPDWLPDLENGARTEDEGLSADQGTGTPAWLAELQGGGAEEDIPEWLAELDSGAGISEWLAEQEEAATAPPSSPSDEEVEAFPPQVAGPLTEAAEPAPGVPQPEERAAYTSAEREEDVEDEGTPDWLRDLEAETEEQPTALDQAAGAAQGGVEAAHGAADVEGDLELEIQDEDAPDWLRDLEEGIEGLPSTPDQAATTPEGDEEAAYEATELTRDLEEGIRDDQVPDWLRDVDETVDELPATVDHPPGAVQPETRLGADERKDALEEDAGDAQLPDWLRDMAASEDEPELGPLFEASATRPSARPDHEADEREDGLGEGVGDAEVPDWLRDLAASEDEPELGPLFETGARPDAQVDRRADESEDETDLGEDAGGEQVPDWLRDLAAGEDEPERGPLPEVGTVQPDAELGHDIDEREGDLEEDAGDEQAPDWLRDLAVGEVEPEPGPAPEAGASKPDWLSLSEEPSAPSTAEEQGEPLNEPGQGPPAWMQEIYTPQREAPAGEEALSLPSGEELAGEETPDWLSSLQGARPLHQGITVETSGPLAGLGGVLSPEPILAIHPKSTFHPMPPVPDAHQAEADLIVRTLETPTSRRIRVSRSPGREILNSLGRWVIYGLLIATVLIAPLRSLVQLPDLAETRAFYNAIEGLQPGDTVLLVFDYDASLDGILTPQARAIIWHLQRRDLGIVLLSLTPQGAAMAEGLIAERTGLVAGRDYIDLGYLPPHPASLLAFVENPIGGAASLGMTEDPARTALGREIQTFSGLDMIVTVSGDHEHIRWWIEQVQTRTPIELLAAVPAGIAPYLTPYYGEMGTGQVAGILGGLGPAAQYEELTGADFVPSARVSYVVQTNALLLLTGVVLASGLGSLLTARRRKDAARRPLPSASGGN
jgi:hypothetical protein